MLPEGWREVRLGDLVAEGALELGDGYRTKSSELSDGGYRIVRAADIAAGRVRLESSDFVAEEFARAIGPKAARAGDVVLTTKGTVGRVAVMPELTEPAVYAPQLCYFRTRGSGGLSSAYLRYWLQSSEFLEQASYMQGNTDMAPYISLSDLRSAEIVLRPLNQQCAIAEVLGALDDKIAANAGVGRIARDCAAARFASCVSSLDAGDDTFEDFALIGGGGTPKTGTAEFWDGEVAWLTPTDVTAIDGSTITATARAITELGLKSCASPLYPVGTIFMTSRATIGAMAIAGRPMAVNQGFIALQPREGLRWWLFHEMKSRVEEFKSWANGATFLEISRGTFRKLPVRRADEAVVRRFEVEAQALHDIEAAADAENRALTATRDALLPALMSGRLTVRHAESLAEEAGL